MNTKERAMHTPTPWYVEERNPVEFTITSGEGGIDIAIVNSNDDDMELENAAFIVKAVNSYEAMREALNKIQLEAACIKSTGGMRIEKMAQDALALSSEA